MSFKISGSLLLIIVSVFFTCSGSSESRTESVEKQIIVDMADRKMEVSVDIRRLVSNKLPGMILIYSLADDLLVARNNKTSNGEWFYCKEKYCQLPVIGSWFLTNENRNIEELLKQKPDLIISAGDITPSGIDATNKDQHVHKIPIYLANTDFKIIPETYRSLGKLLGKEKKANELIQYYETYIPGIITKTSGLDESRKKRVFIAMGNNGLLTPPAHSLHSQVVEQAGGINVANFEINGKRVSAPSVVSIEQIIQWDPDILIICGTDTKSSKELLNDLYLKPKWSNLRAVKNKQLFLAPCQPYSWIDTPPSINQLIGLIWIAKKSLLDVIVYDLMPECVDLVKINCQKYSVDNRVSAMQGMAENMKFEDNSVDLIVSRGSIFFWEDQSKGLSEVYRVLKPGGWAYIGGGFGTEELLKEIEEKRVNNPEWSKKRKERMTKNPPGHFETILENLEIKGKVKFNEAGTWIVFKK